MSSSASTSRSGDRVALDTSVAIDILAAKADARLLWRRGLLSKTPVVSHRRLDQARFLALVPDGRLDRPDSPACMYPATGIRTRCSQ